MSLPHAVSSLRRSWFRLLLGLSVLGAACLPAGRAAAPTPARPPNVVLIYIDDLGYADVGCFGARNIRTPHIDRLAREGSRFTSFYVSQPVCSASRASLLTGCYANRLGIHGALMPESPIGLSTNETTLARLLKDRGYATGMVGKWHLGRPAPFLPVHHGFDQYFGLPYSNDMWPDNPNAPRGRYPALPLIEGDRVLEEAPDQSTLTRRYTERAVNFIEQHRSTPFFLYLAHSQPHVPLFANPRFAGRSGAGLYADVVEELDWSVGEVLGTLDRLGLARDTWVIFTSDNGPWLAYGNHGGSAGPLREGKGTVFEGGIRVPCLMRWPGHIPAGRTSATPLMTIDLLPTIARQVGAAPPPRTIDGLDVWPVLAGQRGATNPHPAYYFYYNTGELQALRSGRWKLYFPHTANVIFGRTPGHDGRAGAYDRVRVGLELYDLETDLGETRNVAALHPDVLARLQSLADAERVELGDSLRGLIGRGVRAPARLPATP